MISWERSSMEELAPEKAEAGTAESKSPSRTLNRRWFYRLGHGGFLSNGGYVKVLGPLLISASTILCAVRMTFFVFFQNTVSSFYFVFHCRNSYAGSYSRFPSFLRTSYRYTAQRNISQEEARLMDVSQGRFVEHYVAVSRYLDRANFKPRVREVFCVQIQ